MKNLDTIKNRLLKGESIYMGKLNGTKISVSMYQGLVLAYPFAGANYYTGEPLDNPMTFDTFEHYFLPKFI